MHRLAAVLTAPALVLLLGVLVWWHDPHAFWVCDNQLFFAPIFEDVARAWRDGEWPILTHSSWATGHLAGEYQCGTFSVFTNLAVVFVWSLPFTVPGKAAAFSLLHLTTLSAGAFLLARRRGLAQPSAVLVAVLASCNGWMLSWAASDWISSLSGFTWVPWLWWALLAAEASRSSLQRWVVPAVCVYLLVAAGNPFSVLMGALVSAGLGLRGWMEKRVNSLGVIAIAWAAGLGLSAPAWLAVLEFAQGSARSEWGAFVQNAWRVPWHAWPALILPSWVSTWEDFKWAAVPHVAVDFSGGLVPLVAILACMAKTRAHLLLRARWDFFLLIACVALAMAPGLGSFRWSFRWLPLFHLVLALIGATALEALPRRTVACAAAASVLTVWALASALGTNSSLLFAATLASLVVGWWVLEVWAPSSWWVVAFASASVLATSWTLPMAQHVSRHHFEENLLSTAPLDPARRYLALYGFEEVVDRLSFQPGAGAVRRPCNLPMLAGLRFLNGYSGFSAAGLPRRFEMHGGVAWETAREWTSPDQTWLLDLLGVDGLIFAPRYEPLARQLGPEWRLVHASTEGKVFHCESRRAAAVKPILFLREQPQLALGQPPLRVLHEGRQSVEVEVEDDPRPVWLAFQRPWYPGYEATLNGRPVPVRAYLGLLPVVALPPHTSGVIALRYRPTFLRWGVPVSLLTLALLASVCFFRSSED